MTPRLAIVASTGGSVLGRLLEVPSFRDSVVTVVADRPCGAVEVADAWGIPPTVLPAAGGAEFSASLLSHLDEVGVDYGVLFYTRRLEGELLSRYEDRILNLHPSLLPAFKGLHPFDDALAAGARITGTTIHLIDGELDGGKIVMQSATAIDPLVPYDELRHRLFVQQCKSLLQVVAWIRQGRLAVSGGRVAVAGATYDDVEYAPALDDVEALGLEIPLATPGTSR
jgi:phosphoribosylglycinamide formyltransferase-1